MNKMVRCEEFYKYFEKKGNFCNKGELTVRKVEEYIAYVKRNRIGTYKISNCALDPFISIEFIKDGMVHRRAIKELKDMMKKKKFPPEKITRRISIEIINRANNQVGDVYRLDRIPGIRKRMGEYEHDIGSISIETRSIFDSIKKDIGINSNDMAMKIMLECCVRNIDDVRKIKREMEDKEKSERALVITT